MKILHTADWHIGKLVHGVYMTEMQREFFDSLYRIIEEKKPDVLVIAGDIYDRSIPPVEAVQLLNQIFDTLLNKYMLKVIVITGNHDSKERVSFLSTLLRDKGLYIFGDLSLPFEPVEIKDSYGSVYFYPIPYLDPVTVRYYSKDESIKSHNDAAKYIIDNVKFNKKQRNICVFHGFLSGGFESESERPLSVGGTDCVDASIFKDFDYVALGHLHGPQKVNEEYIRYSGSICKYSFSEVNQKKGVTYIEMNEKGNTHIEKIPIKLSLDFRIIEGEISELLNPNVYEKTNTKDFIMAILTDEGEIIDPIKKLRSVYPNILLLERKREINNKEMGYSKKGSERLKMDPIDLMMDFYKEVSDSNIPFEHEEEIKKIFDEVIQKQE